MKPRSPHLTGALALTGFMLLAGAASAQSPSSLIQKGPIVEGTGKTRAERGPPPPGLPGTATGKDRIIPQDRIATDMAPTEALFDSINRGDINSARDALNRGADFNAKNILSMTPLDESIDLGRNDITFLLLSLRGSSPTPTSEQAAGTPAKGSKPTKAAQATPAPKPVAPAPRPVAQVQPSRQPVQQQGPRPGDAGTPNSQTGFLGFGG